jgi:hypothetical protein
MSETWNQFSFTWAGLIHRQGGKSTFLSLLLPLAALAFFVAHYTSEVQAQTYESNAPPVIIWAESRNVNGGVTRLFDNNEGSAGESIGLILYADTSLLTNNTFIGRIKCDVAYPTNNVAFFGGATPNPYIGSGYGLSSTNDLFYGANMSTTNIVDLTTDRAIVSGTSPLNLPNQYNKGMHPFGMYNFNAWPYNNAGQGTFNIKNIEVFDINGNRMAATGANMTLVIYTNDSPIYALTTRALIIPDNITFYGQDHESIWVEAFATGATNSASAPFSLQKSSDLNNWATIKVSEFSTERNKYVISYFIDPSSMTESNGFYGVVR